MNYASPTARTLNVWLKLAAVALTVVALGLPINDLFHYALLVVASIIIFSGCVENKPARWLAAIVLAIASLAIHTLFSSPQIEEGHNIFIVDGNGGALERELPPSVYEIMRAEFDTAYPVEKRCARGSNGCWRDAGFPDRPFAFSPDALLEPAEMTRRVSTIAIADPIWARLGAINDMRYNWTGISDMARNERKDHWWQFSHPWKFTMPFYVAYRLPAALVGSELCWSGTVLWQEDWSYATQRHSEWACKTIDSNNSGRLVFGLSIAQPLKISLQPKFRLLIWRWLGRATALLAVVGILLLLARAKRENITLNGTLVLAALAIVFFNDASFIGGIRPFDGGDDGLFYESVSRDILQFAMSGNLRSALEGGEPVFYYGGPGLRYLRAFEHVIFGDSFLGYLSLILALPTIIFTIYRRFFSDYIALALTVVFVALPVGAIFGTSFFHYAKWSARGFADPAAAFFFFAGIVVLVGKIPRPRRGFWNAFGAGALFALALWVRPNLAPGAAILLSGAAVAALSQYQFSRILGLCIGFAPVFGMALHNWYFGSVFVLFSSNATIVQALPMPPSAYLGALLELLHFDLHGANIARGLLQWGRWLSGPSDSFVMIPLHALSIFILVRVLSSGRYDNWLRLIAASALALHPVAWFYLSADRYYYVQWFLTALVFSAWTCDEVLPWIARYWPKAWESTVDSLAAICIKSAFDCYARACGFNPVHSGIKPAA